MKDKSTVLTAVEYKIADGQLIRVRLDKTDGVPACVYERTHAVAGGVDSYGAAGEENVFDFSFIGWHCFCSFHSA